jgi:hypothetical protein
LPELVAYDADLASADLGCGNNERGRREIRCNSPDERQ